MTQTACPLDCYDACAITCDASFPTKLIATPTHPTSNGSLCAILNKYMHEAPRIETPRINNQEVSMREALDAVASALKSKEKLLWKGSGNLGVMQDVTSLLMNKLSGHTTKGSLCDGAGAAGILEGRGCHYQLSPEQISKSDVVVVWGRNLTVTNKHIIPYIEGKKLIVIDPVATPIAKRADLHLQIEPRSDFLLAIMLARFLFMECSEDSTSCDKNDLEEFYEFTQDFRINHSLKRIGVDMHQIGHFLSETIGKKVVFLLGAGIQKYNHSHYIFWAIDSLVASMGLFGKEGCGVSYLGNSKQGFDEVFQVNTKQVSVVNTPFDKFDTVLVQGGNPVESMPDTNRVIESISQVEHLIYYGLYENETSRLADIVIPAKTFLEKDDIRLCYGHQYITKMNKALISDIGISEYEFTKEICTALSLDSIEPEEVYLRGYTKQFRYSGSHPILPDHQETPYANGFGENGSDDFAFIDDFSDDYDEEGHEGYWLLSPKSSSSLGTQFVRSHIIRVPVGSGFENNETVLVKSPHGECRFEVLIDENLLPSSVVISAGTYGLNYLTPSAITQEGESPCYQDVKVTLCKV